ncbi:MAG: protein translocase subunit SecD [Naasia sp.]
MANTPTPVRKARRSLIALGAIFLLLIGAISVGVSFFGASWTPRLALDLEGGTEVRLAPVVEGGQEVTSEQLNQAVSIIRDRVDAAGVSEAEIRTEGSGNIVVSIPGEASEETLARISASAKLDFRPVLLAGVPATAATETPAADDTTETAPAPEPTDASDLAQVTPELQTAFDDFDCATIDETVVPPADQPYLTCEIDGTAKYLLGPVELSGENLSDATSSQQTTQTGAATGSWAVNLQFDGEGTEQFASITSRLTGLESPRNQFAMVLDNRVLLAPSSNVVITDGRAAITGPGITQDSAPLLADQLKYGALPVSFETQSQDSISATLGSEQLASGLLAGLIGLVLVVAYSLAQYRALGLVTVASLVVAGALTYLIVTLLGWRLDFRLSLAGVAGLIIAIGVTADSFIVYFERIKDELRDGKMLTGAVEAGWKRALRTILASDAINFLAALILILLAVGNVRGFAVTLGLTTIIDLIVVVLFTHPMLQLLSRTRFFSEGHRASGLDPRALGAVYRGRAQFREPVAVAKRNVASRGEAQKRQTIAERKAAESSGTATATLDRPESAPETTTSPSGSTKPRGKKGARS